MLETSVLETQKVGQIGPQRSDTLSTYFVAIQIKVLQRRNVGEVGPQRSGT